MDYEHTHEQNHAAAMEALRKSFGKSFLLIALDSKADEAWHIEEFLQVTELSVGETVRFICDLNHRIGIMVANCMRDIMIQIDPNDPVFKDVEE